MSSCPGEATLWLLGTNVLGDRTYTEIEQHVEGCAECKDVLQRRLRQQPERPFSPDAGGFPTIQGFNIRSELGRGATGVVYLAIETGLDRPVALKILAGAIGSDASFASRRRWLREARAVSRVRHPNVVPLYDFGASDGFFFLVFEYIPGGTLKQRLTGPLAPLIAARLVEAVARAVVYIHACGVVHLDLKPSNILLDGDENSPWDRITPRVSDFGVAVSGSDRDVSGTSLAAPRGTPSYMAPEQATGDVTRIGAAADIYALGATLYHLLTGRPPFQGASAIETLDQVRNQEPVPPRRLNPRIPRDLETVALKCLEKNPFRRYESADALADDLNRFLEGRPINARPVSTIERASRWCRRQPVITALVAILILTVLGSFLELLALLRRSELQRSRSEANYEVASRSLDELLMTFAEDIEKYEQNPYAKSSRLRTIEVARSQEVELSNRYPLEIRNLRRLALIDSYLAAFHCHVGNQDEAWLLMEEAVGCWDTYLSLVPNDCEIRVRQFDEMITLLGSVIGTKNDHLFGRWNAKAIMLLKRLRSDNPNRVVQLFRLAREQRRHADYLMLRAEWDTAQIELGESLDLVRSGPIVETTSPEFVISEASTRAALAQWSGEFKLFSTPFHSRPMLEGSSPLDSGLAELTARRIGWLPSMARSEWLIPKSVSTEKWTERAVDLLRSYARTFGLNDDRIPTIAWTTRHHCLSTLGWLRKAGKLGDANRIADQLVALADRLTRSHTNQIFPQMLLSEAYVQKAKNAHQEREKAAIERWERKALEAAAKAATFDPGSDLARSLVENRRARVNRLTPK